MSPRSSSPASYTGVGRSRDQHGALTTPLVHGGSPVPHGAVYRKLDGGLQHIGVRNGRGRKVGRGRLHGACSHRLCRVASGSTDPFRSGGRWEQCPGNVLEEIEHGQLLEVNVLKAGTRIRAEAVIWDSDGHKSVWDVINQECIEELPVEIRPMTSIACWTVTPLSDSEDPSTARTDIERAIGVRWVIMMVWAWLLGELC